MWKWGAFAIFGGLLLGLIIYVKVFEEPIDRHEAVNAVTIADIVTGILGDAPDDVDWSGRGQFGIDNSILSTNAEDAISAALDKNMFPAEFAQLEGEMGLALKAGADNPSEDPVRAALVNIASIRARAVGDDSSEAVSNAISHLSNSSEYVKTATSLEQWMRAQAARLVVLEGMTASLENDGWSDQDLQALLNATEPSAHRKALAQVLHHRFVRELQPRIVEYSETRLLSEITAKSLYEEPTKEESELLGVLLHRHTKGFSPEATAESGAESLRQLMSALGGPWSGCQAVLDEVAKLHAVWFDYREVMQMSDSDAIVGIKNLKLRLDKLENPVGMAVLHEERTSWSNLVQAAYVADAYEAAFRSSLQKLSGLQPATGDLIDPLTGGKYEESGSNMTDVGDEYGFIRAYIAERQAP